MEKLSNDKCYKFWKFMLEHLGTNKEKKLCDSLTKLPATSGNDEIFLVDKADVFIPDNLHLKKLFGQENVFVWYPQHNLTPMSRSKLFDIYRKVGARDISESVCKQESSLLNGVELNPNNIFKLKGLVMLILSYLSCSSLQMEPEKRHEAVQDLINLSFLETMEPINVSYSLALSSGNIITKEANKMVCWDRQNSKFFIQKSNGLIGNSLKYATYFSEAISQGVLRENHDHVQELSELIALAFVLEFKDEEIEFLMESKNMQIFYEDEEFLSSAFPSDGVPA